MGAAVVVAMLIGVSLARFTTASPAESVAPPPPPPASLDEELQLRTAEAEARPEDPLRWLALSAEAVSQAAVTGDPSRYVLAEQALERADEAAPGDPRIVVARGHLALSLHAFAEALELGERALTELPANPDALAVVVDAQVELGHYDDAAQTLQRLLDRDPGLPALARTSYLRELHGDLTGALHAMLQAERAGAGDPVDVATIAALRGDLHLRLGQLDEAEQAYEAAARLLPQLAAATVGLARLDAVRGETERGIQRLAALTDRYPQPGALALLADLQNASGRDAGDTVEVLRAVADLQASAGQDSDLEMALVETDLGEPARGLELARRAHAARPDNVFTADALAWALHRSGDAAAAWPIVQQALRLGTADASLRYHAAVIAEAVGERDRAREELRQALAVPAALPLRYAPDARQLAERLQLTAAPSSAGEVSR